VGGQSFAESSSFQNLGFRVRAGSAIGYSVFPYSESTRRSFRLLYFTGVEVADYAEVTIFGKAEEVQARHSLTTAVEFEQPWGSVDVSLDLSRFLSRPEKYRAQLRGGLNLRWSVAFRSISTAGTRASATNLRSQLQGLRPRKSSRSSVCSRPPTATLPPSD